MPGQEVPPNITAAESIAFFFNLTRRDRQFVDQYPVDASTDKVTNFASRLLKFRLKVRFDETLFIE